MLHSLAYLGISSPAADEWPTFATEVLGCMLAEPGPDGAVRLRVDDALWRIQIHAGEVDAVDYFGWAVTDEASLDELQGRLEAEGVEVHEGDAELAVARAVNRIRWFVDPWGYRHELIWGQIIRPSSFRPGRAISRFITGQQGLGHVVVGMPDLERAHDFFTRVLGFELSDKIITDKLEAHFYHVNGRHHSLALGRLPEGVVGFNHLMLQLEAIDDVGVVTTSASSAVCRSRRCSAPRQRPDGVVLLDHAVRLQHRVRLRRRRDRRGLDPQDLRQEQHLGSHHPRGQPQAVPGIVRRLG
ncbi:VOC family protein [Streptomyces sp. INA 01156]